MMIVMKCVYICTLIRLSECAESNMEPYIVGGAPIEIKSYPHSAYLDAKCVNKTEHWICGSSVLNQRVLLTAAHCVRGCAFEPIVTIDRVLVALGHASVKQVTIIRKAKRMKIHECFNEKNFDNDISLLLVGEDIPLGNTIKRVMITRNFPCSVGSCAGYVAGWGTTTPHAAVRAKTPGGNHLKEVRQILISSEVCATKTGKLHDGMFCAGSLEGGTDYPSSGDSGSALVTENTRYHQIGLVSFSMRRTPTLMVYTNVSYYYTWISTYAQQLYCNYILS